MNPNCQALFPTKYFCHRDICKKFKVIKRFWERYLESVADKIIEVGVKEKKKKLFSTFLGQIIEVLAHGKCQKSALVEGGWELIKSPHICKGIVGGLGSPFTDLWSAQAAEVQRSVLNCVCVSF